MRYIAGHPRSAFSLMELLVVIAIVTIMLALLLPVVGLARQEAYATACLSRHAQWGSAFMSYQVANNDILPLYADKYDSSAAIGGGAWSSLWYNVMAPYMGLPHFTESSPINDKYRGEAASQAARQCEADPTAYLGVHYGGFNSTTPPYAPINYGRHTNVEPNITYRKHNDRNPSKWMMLCDTIANSMYSPLGWPRTVDHDGDGIPDSNAVAISENPAIAGYYNRGRPTAHRNTGTYAFVDGHCERIPFEEWLRIDHPMWTGQ